MKPNLFLVTAGLLYCAGLAAGAPATAKSEAMKLLETAPLRFEPAGSPGRFVARGARYRFEFSNRQATLHADGRTIALHFDAADPRARIESEEKLQSKTNLYLGNDASRWRQGVANYGRLRVPTLYPGIDLIYYGNAQELEYDLKIAPGAEPGRIRFHITGAQAGVDQQGNLVADLIQKRPVAYQITAAGVRTAVPARYRRNPDGSFGFALANYDSSRELIIDPVLTFSRYLSGSNQDIAYAIQHDQNGFLYVAGTTKSSDFPSAGTPTQSKAGGGGDVWVAQINPNAPAGQQLLFTTYVGGSGTETFGGLAVSPKGDIYVTGSTESTDLPVTASAYKASMTNAPNTNAFLVWINSSQLLAYSTYLGGSKPDNALGIALDSKGRVWITGGAQSTDFPTVNPLQVSNAGAQDIFIAGIDPTQSGSSSLFYSTYFGGSGWDTGRGIAIAADGTLWIAGGTYSYNAPVKSAYQSNYHGGGDAYLIHVDPTLGPGGLVYATFLGGSSLEEARNVVLDPSGPIIISGYTISPDLPVTSNALQPAYGGNADGFISILNPSDSSQLVYSTYFGGVNDDIPFDLKRDPSGTLYLAGLTLSPGLPVTEGALQSAYDNSWDIFVLRLNPSRAGASGLDYLSYLGSDGLQVGYGVDFAANGIAYVVGSASGPIFDALGGAAKTSASGKIDAFVAGFPICGFSLSLLSQQFPAAGATSTIQVLGPGADCNWSASSSLDWVILSPTSGSGDGTVIITVTANTTGSPRRGDITIAGISFLVGQDASTPAASHFRR